MITIINLVLDLLITLPKRKSEKKVSESKKMKFKFKKN